MPDAIPPLPPTTPPPMPSQQLSPEEKNARTWNMLCHLSALSGHFIPFGNVLGPLVVWQIKKNEIPSVEVHGKAALNFQLTVLMAVIVSGLVGFVTLAVCIGFLFFILGGVIWVAGVIFAIIAGINANDGKEFKYPYSFTFV